MILVVVLFCRSTGALNRGGGGHGKQKISFSRRFPFMKSRERLNKLDDEDSFENGSNHRSVEYQHLPTCPLLLSLFFAFFFPPSSPSRF